MGRRFRPLGAIQPTLESPGSVTRLLSENDERGAERSRERSIDSVTPELLFYCGFFSCAPTASCHIPLSLEDPIVQWPRTPPFHGGNTGSNPVRVASLPLHLNQLQQGSYSFSQSTSIK
jgi:hypothetical protein